VHGESHIQRNTNGEVATVPRIDNQILRVRENYQGKYL